ncbi:MAG: S41 family peptidase [Pirellulaceae bacterium]|nr:S41 family peptidase [Pirellulaceae bacterium]
MPVRNIQILLLVMFVSVACCVQAERLKYAGKIGYAIGLIEQNYVEEVDPQDLYVAAMQGIVSRLDQNSAFIPPQKYQEFQEVIEQQFGGVGILIEGPPVVKRLTVVAPILGSPAFEAGVQPGDVILEINGESTEGLEANDATSKMRGPVGAPVTIKVQRMNSSETAVMTIIRADVQVDSVFGDHIQSDSKWNYFLEEDPRIAYIRVTLFGERTTEEFRSAIEAVKDTAKAIVIDLRSNPGGILRSAVDMCDMLLDRGVIVSTRGRNEQFGSERVADHDVLLPLGIPMVVLVNGDSASASEIMAACLKDSGRAMVAGQRSYGKGTVQQVFDLQDNQTAIKVTTAKFYRPNGKNIHRSENSTESDDWGVSPDPELLQLITPLEELYLYKRWNSRGDPRLTSAAEKPPAPQCEGDPQLSKVLKYLQGILKE